MLACLPTVTIRPTREYDAKAHSLSGPLLSAVLEAAGAAASAPVTLALRALDGCTVALSLTDARGYRMIVATTLDGVPMSLGGLGPLWAVYDADHLSAFKDKPLEERVVSIGPVFHRREAALHAVRRRADQMSQRRLFVTTLGVALVCHAALLRAQTPAASLRRVGVLAPSTQAKEEITLKPFFDQMRELGWIEGQNIAYDRVYADDQQARLPRLAAELVARKPELIYAPPQPAALAAKQATRTIPIVFGTGTDPVRSGLVSSMAHPGGNVTGVVGVIDSLQPKRVELLHEILPGAKRFGLLGDPNDPRLNIDRNALAPVAAALGLTIIVGEASNPVEFDAAVARLIGQGVDVIIGIGSIVTNLRERLIDLANRRRLPVVGSFALIAEAGALFTYGASLPGTLRRSAQLVDKVLNGAKPADMAVEQPTLFELVVNLKAAKALGITIPRSILLRADRFIE